jgi:aryl-alcohol dehydrogenase-like predicted oxidoreductase
MGSGLLTGAMNRERIALLPQDDWRRRSVHFQEPKLTRNLAIAQKVVEESQHLGRSPAEVALGWVLAHPAVTAAIVGLRSADQVAGVRGALDWKIPADVRLRLDQASQMD